MMEATTGPLITHQRAVFSFVSQHLVEGEDGSKKVVLLFRIHERVWTLLFPLKIP